MKNIVLILVLQFSICFGFAQEHKAFVMFITPENSEILIDGELVGTAYKDRPFKTVSIPGEHIILANSLESGLTYSDKVILKENNQTIVTIKYNSTSKNLNNIIIDIADIDLNIPGIASITAKQGTYNSEEYDEYPTYYYAFESGDEIIFTVDMRSNIGKNAIYITKYPGDSIIYSNDSFQSLNNINFSLPERSIYKFEFRTNHAFDKKGRFIVKRKPKYTSSVNFITEVEWRTVADTSYILEENDELNGTEIRVPKISFKEKAFIKNK